MDDNSSVITPEPISGQRTEFTLLLLVEIFSILCTLLIFVHVYCNWTTIVSKALQNHAILLIVLISFTYTALDLPFTISSYRLGYDIYRTAFFCQWWYWIDDTLISLSLLITAIASLQRYILIFKSHLLRVRRTRWLLHYLPLIAGLVYSPLFYLIVIFFYPCDRSAIPGNSDDALHCSSPCYTNNTVLMNTDWILHSVLPLLVIILSHVVLIGWIICTMRPFQREQTNMRKKQKKLTFQLLAFASLYFIGWTPSTIVSVLEAFGLTELQEHMATLTYVYFMSYFICPLQPFICLFVLPEPILDIQDRIKQLLGRFGKKFVGPSHAVVWSARFVLRKKVTNLSDWIGLVFQHSWASWLKQNKLDVFMTWSVGIYVTPHLSFGLLLSISIFSLDDERRSMGRAHS